MALENPITSDDLTIDFAALLDMSVSNRVQAAASDNTFAQALMASLTPIQMAKAFPDYYRQELPDISNFILANRYLDENGKDAFDQKGGGDPGKDTALYDGEVVPEETVPRIPGPQSEVEKSKVEQILEKAGITGTATGETGVTSAIKDEKGFIISTADTSLSPAQRALLDTIAVGDPTKDTHYWESPDYNTIVNGGKFTDFSHHPRIFGTKNSTAAGRYQFTKSTWDGTKGHPGVVEQFNKENPDNPITDFSPANQDRAALWLAQKDYRRRTGRDLNADIENPPENFGELLKAGLGGGAYAGLKQGDTTWEIFQQKTPEQAGNAFNANLARNQGYLEQEIEAEAKKKEGVENQIKATPELMKQFENDEKVQKYFADNPEVANKVQEAINSGKITVDDVTSIVSKTNSPQISTSNLENVIEQQQKVAGVRKGAIKTELKKSLSYAADQAGDDQYKIVVAVTSGGQRMEGAEGATGSHRHDEGGAADFNAYLVNRETGERTVLDPRKKEHIPYLTKLTTEFSRVHPDAGVGALYMDDPTKIHFGGDDVSEHGGRARGAVAYSGPDWFKQAHAEGISQRQEDIKNKNNVLLDWEQKKQEPLIASAGVEETPGAEAPRVFVGDSIAQGLKDAAGGEGHTIVSRKPHQVLADMENLGQEYFKGKNVVLSTGLSNNTQDIESVRKQMEFLKNAGANVQVAGMSNSREDLAPGNQQLQQLSSEYGYSFMGGFDAGKDKMHPTSYSKYATEAAESIRAAEADGHDHSHDGVDDHVEATPTDDSSDLEKKNDLLKDIADRMGIAPDKLVGNFKNGVPVEINGQKVPEELYNEVEKKKIEEASHAAERDVSEHTQTAEADNHDGHDHDHNHDGIDDHVETASTAEIPAPIQTAEAEQQEVETVQITKTKKSGAESLPESHPFSMNSKKKKRIIEAQNAKTETTTTETPEPIVYDGRRELFQTAEAVVGEQPAISKLNKPSVIAPGTNKHQADMGNATSVGPFPSTEEAPVAPIQTAEAAPSPVQVAEGAPVQVAEAISVPTAGTEEVRTFRTGGSPDVQDDENLSVFDEDGSLKWKMNSGEGIYVKPKDTEYADDKIDELSGRVDDIDQRSDTPEKNQPKAAPDKAHGRPEKNWQQNASSVTYSIGSQGRAFKRTKFQNEGFHFNRSAPNSTSS